MKAKVVVRPQFDVRMLPIVLAPQVFRSIEVLAQKSLLFGGNHPELRTSVGQVMQEMRKVARLQFGHDTVDVTTLKNLLARGDVKEQEKLRTPEPDPFLMLGKKLDASQMNAAYCIREIWNAFGRFLRIAGRNFEGGSGTKKRSRALDPIDVMGQETWEVWRDRYSPWVVGARQRRQPTKREQGFVTHAAVVVFVLMEDYHPEQVDRTYNFRDGKSLTVIRSEMDLFNDPQQKILPLHGLKADTSAIMAA
jgi:hypothetical protein